MRITRKLIKENLDRIEKGEALSVPLSVLNGKFKKIYQKENMKAYQKAYRKTDKYKAYNKAYQKAYHKTDKWKAYKKAYYRRKGGKNDN